jgi:4,4'-diaponeurosporenoate glycosyltransferase
MEDVALASSYRRAGLPVTLYAGGGTVRFRMHDGGLGSIVRGWTRGLGDGARRVRLVTVAAVAVWLSGVVSAPLVAVVRPRLGLALCAAYAVQLWWLGRRVGRYPAVSWLLFPVPAAVFVGVFCWSTAGVLLGRPVTWKGRRVRP